MGSGPNRSNFPEGIFAQGIAIPEGVMGGGGSVTSGTTFWVSSVTGSNGNNGSSPDTPFGTIDYAVGRCTDNKGDVIYVMEGHKESYDAADGFDADVAGISIIGLGNGTDRPEIEFTDTDGTVAIGADNVLIDNLQFNASLPSVVDGVIIEDGVDWATIKNCIFDTDTTITDAFVDCISLVNNNSYCVIEGCDFDMGLQALSAAAIHANADTDHLTVRYNTIRGDYSVGCIVGDTTLSTHVHIHNNLLINGDTNGLNTVACIVLLANSTGVIHDNLLITNVANADAAITADKCISSNNRYSETVDVFDGTGYIGADNASNSANTGNVAADEDGSVLERLEQIQEAVNKGSGTSMATNKSIVDALGTDGTTPIDAATSVLGAIGVNDASNAMDSSAVTSDNDGSVFERLEYVGLNANRGVKKTVGSLTTANLFTITGFVKVVNIIGYVTTAGQASANNTKLVMTPTGGTATDLCAVLDFTAVAQYSILNITGTFANAIVETGVIGLKALEQADAFLTSAGVLSMNCANTTSGVIDWHIEYVPMSSDALIVAA